MLGSTSFLHSPVRLLRWLPVECVTELKSSTRLSSELHGPILYWMSASARCECNYALEAAVEIASANEKEVAIAFFMDPRYPNANERSFRFLLEGLVEVNQGLKRRGLKLSIKHCSCDPHAPRQDVPSLVLQYLQQHQVSCLIMDCGYSRIARQWRDLVRHGSDSRMNIVLIEDLVLIPTKLVSTTPVDSAKLLRERQKPHLDRFTNVECPTPTANLCRLYDDTLDDNHNNDNNDEESNCWSLDGTGDITKIMNHIASAIGSDSFHYVPASTGFKGGCIEAKRHLATFLRDHLSSYKSLRNKPEAHCQSNLSSYLHYGQISVAYIVRNVKRHKTASWEDKYKFLDALVCRREVAINHVLHEINHDNYDCLPLWAQSTISDEHSHVEKKLLTREQLEKALTPDRLWNAAQLELVFLGKMHGYLRMYWCKQILRWQTPRDAVETAIWLNDKYSLDGRDPNGHFGVMWCFGKQDHPFSPSRPIFGTLRSMSVGGAGSKFDTNGYIYFIMKECARLIQTFPILADRSPRQDIRQSMFMGGHVTKSSSSIAGNGDPNVNNSPSNESGKRSLDLDLMKGGGNKCNDDKKAKSSSNSSNSSSSSATGGTGADRAGTIKKYFLSKAATNLEGSRSSRSSSSSSSSS